VSQPHGDAEHDPTGGARLRVADRAQGSGDGPQAAVSPPESLDGTGSSTAVPRLPTPALQPFIRQYLGYRLVGFPPGLHRGLPGRYLTFIVSLDRPIDVVVQTDPGQAPASYGFVLGGLQIAPAVIAHDGNQEGVAIQLTPLGSRALLGMPAGALWNTTVEAHDALGPLMAELRERLHLSSDWSVRFRLIDEVLCRLVDDRARVAPEIGESWRLLVRTGGTISVAKLAAEVGWSRRHLAQRFSAEFGCPPKLAARVIRFEEARRMLQRPDRPSLAEVAAVCGYYDQPHLNRDFAELAGCSPTEWIATENLAVPAPDGDAEAAPERA
jgi:AraC-like DNA-binding protein